MGGTRNTGGDTRTKPNQEIITGKPRPIDDDKPDTTPSGIGRPTRTNVVTTNIRQGASVIGAKIPKVYGAYTVPGYLAARARWDGWYFIYIFCFGEQDSLDAVRVNGREIWPVSTGTSTYYWWNVKGTWLGDGTPLTENEISRVFANYRPLSTQEKSDLAKFCGICFKIDDQRWPETISTMNVEADVGGQLCYDFRDTTWKSTQNPALVAYDVCTSDYWMDLPAASVGTGAAGTWDDFADFCDETMSDASERYHFGGLIAQSSAKGALKYVLNHAFADVYTDENGVLQIRHDGPPGALAGDWTASTSTLVIEDGEDDGTATTDLAVDDWVAVGTSIGKVASITSDHRIVLDRVITETSAKLRKLTDIEISKSDWEAPPRVGDVPKNQIPDDVVVQYTDPETFQPNQYPDQEDLTAGGKWHKINLGGCVSRTFARRYSETAQQMAEFQTFKWSGTIGPIGKEITPGAIVAFSTDTLTDQLAKVDTIRWNFMTGTYSIKLTEFDIASFSENTEAEDTPPTITYDPADAPTAYTETFGETGPWDDYSIIVNPDDISGWTWDSGLAAAYDGVDDETELTLTSGTSGWKYGYVDITSDLVGSDGGTSNVLFVSLMRRWTNGQDINTQMNLEYWSGADHASATRQQAARITPFDAQDEFLWDRIVHTFAISSDAHHELRIAVRNIDPTAMTADSDLAVKRLRVVTWGVQGEPTSTPYDTREDHVTSKLRVYKKYTWTQHGSAADTVDYYGLVWSNGNIVTQVFQDEAEVIVWDHATTLQRFNGTYWSGKGGNSENFTGFSLAAVGLNGKSVAFPTPTQAFESDAAPPQITEMTRHTFTGGFGTSYSRRWYPTEDGGPPVIDARYELPEAAWSDYWLELWVDEAGGTNYVQWCRAEWPNSVYVGDDYTGYGAQQYSQVPASGYTYEVRLVGKYSGKSTALVAPGTNWTVMAASPTASPALAAVVAVTDGQGGTTDSAGPIMPLIPLESDSTTNDRWLNVDDLPEYDGTGPTQGTMLLRITSRGSTEQETYVDEFMISNQDEATEAQVWWQSKHLGGTRQYTLQIWRQADKTDQIWVKAEQDPSTLLVERLWVPFYTGMPGSYPDFVLTSDDVDISDWTTTAPSVGTKGFDTDTDTPGFEYDLVAETLEIGGASVTDKYTQAEVDALMDDRGPWLHLDCTTTATYRLIKTMSASTDKSWMVRLFHNNQASKPHYDEFILQYNSGAWRYVWTRLSSPTVGYTDVKGFIQVWRPNAGVSDEGELWLCAETDNGSVAVQVMRLDAGTLGTGFTFVDAFEGAETTTAPSTGTKDFDSNTATPSFQIAGNAGTCYQNGNEILSGKSGQINSMTEKATPVSADLIVIEDSAASNAKKKVQIGNLPGGGSGVTPVTTGATYAQSSYLYTSGSWQTLVSISGSAPYILHHVGLSYLTSGNGNIRVTIDGTLVYTGTALSALGVFVGPGSSYMPSPFFADTSILIEYYNSTTGGNRYDYSYQEVTYS